MFEVRLHGALWRRVNEARASEWRRALDEINASNGFAVNGEALSEPALELVHHPDGTYYVRLYDDGFDLVADVPLDRAAVSGFFDEYGATIQQLVHVDREAPVRGFEAIDYAKRVVHDEAAAYLREALQDVVVMDLSDARRLFTLVFLVGTDLPERLVRYHRRH